MIIQFIAHVALLATRHRTHQMTVAVAVTVAVYATLGVAQVKKCDTPALIR